MERGAGPGQACRSLHGASQPPENNGESNGGGGGRTAGAKQQTENCPTDSIGVRQEISSRARQGAAENGFNQVPAVEDA